MAAKVMMFLASVASGVAGSCQNAYDAVNDTFGDGPCKDGNSMCGQDPCGNAVREVQAQCTTEFSQEDDMLYKDMADLTLSNCDCFDTMMGVEDACGDIPPQEICQSCPAILKELEMNCGGVPRQIFQEDDVDPADFGDNESVADWAREMHMNFEMICSPCLQLVMQMSISCSDGEPPCSCSEIVEKAVGLCTDETYQDSETGNQVNVRDMMAGLLPQVQMACMGGGNCAMIPRDVAMMVAESGFDVRRC